MNKENSENVQEFVCGQQSIERVAIYNGTAEVTRKLKVQLQSGENVVLIKEMPINLVRDSIRIDGRAHATINSVQIEKERDEKDLTEDSRVRQLKENIEEKKNEIAETKRKIKVAENRRQLYLKAVNEVKFGPGGDKEALSKSEFFLNRAALSSLEENIEFFAKKFDELTLAEFEKEGEMKKLEDELKELTEKFQKITFNQKASHDQVRITLDGDEGGDAELLLIYRVTGAAWTPEYDLRIDDHQNLKLIYAASISQKTGEDWNNAKLLLSTAKPAPTAAILQLNTLKAVLKSKQEENRNIFSTAAELTPTFGSIRDSKSTGGALFGCSSSAQAQTMQATRTPQPPPQPPQETTVKSNDVNVEYETSKPATIRNGNSEYRVILGTASLSVDLLHECIPAKHSAVYLFATGTNTSAMALLSGPGNVYINNAFVAKIKVAEIMPNEKFSMFLGHDATVSVESYPVHKFYEEIGTIAKHSSTSYEQKFKVKNTKSNEVTLRLKHQIPKSTDQNIEVCLLIPEAKKEKPTDDAPYHLGAFLEDNLEWTITLNAKEEKNLTVKYKIDYPKNDKIVFLESNNSRLFS